MGYWGDGLFQSDHDLDLLCVLARQIGVDDFYCPDEPEKLLQKLDGGKLEAEFRKLHDGYYDSDEDMNWYGIKTSIVILAAAAMRHGATISDEFRQSVKDCLECPLMMHEKAKDDMRKGIDAYRNGVPLDLAGMGLIETVNSMKDADSRVNGRPQGASNPAT